MNFCHNSYVFDDVFSLEEINILRRDQHFRPQGISGDSNLAKSLDYHLSHSMAYKIIKPKLDSLLGDDHQVTNGCYRECQHPYATHVDNYSFHKPFYSFESSRKKYSCAVLIPLVQDPEFRTVLFNAHSDQDLGTGKLLPESFLTSQNNLEPNWFTHLEKPVRDQIPMLSVDKIFYWKLGSMVTWPRTQLHSSTDFSKYGLTKKFAILFLD